MAKAKRTIKATSEAKLFQKYGAGRGTDVVIPSADQLILPSDLPVVNYTMGGGIPYGRIMELLGEESGGKSLLAMHFVKVAQKMGGLGIWVDAEMSMTEEWAELNGIEFEDLVVFKETAVEVISDFLGDACLTYREELTDNEPIVVVIDSTAALDSILAMDMSQEESKAEMGARAKAIYKMLRLRNKLWSDLGICVIFINQLRDTISTGFQAGKKEDTSPGGKAIRYYAAIRLALYHQKQYKIGDKRVGAEVFIRTKKNKVGPPRGSAKGRMVFDSTHYEDVGFQPTFGLDELLQDLDAVEKKGNAFYFDGEKIANGKDDFTEVLEEDEELRDDLLAEAGIYTVRDFQKRLDDTDHNIYEVE